ncbi:MAG TPA: glycine cleavage system protein GcvH [Anaerolineae bacterium]|nr:glycine cleavage system protein GcvH [Anaerolineae bacterium]
MNSVEIRYNKTHEWARKEGDVFVVGISDYAQNTLSDVVYVELPAVGDEVTRGESFGVVESVKAASDVYAPLSGKVTAINKTLDNAPEVINEDPLGDGWLIKVQAADPAEWEQLLDSQAYADVVAAEG